MINTAKLIEPIQRPILLVLQKERKEKVAQAERPILKATCLGDAKDSTAGVVPHEGTVFEVEFCDKEKVELFVPFDNGTTRYDCAAPIKKGRKTLDFQEIRNLLGRSVFGFPSKNLIEKLKSANSDYRNTRRKRLLTSFDIKDLSLS